jgi:glutathionylspermidine synthase
MKRKLTARRPQWQQKVEADGLVWHTGPQGLYWDESVYYSFTPAQVAQLEDATRACYAMYLQAAQYVLDNNLLDRFGIPAAYHQPIRDAWDAEPPALNYGRFDFGYDGVTPPKLFEFNADTPTSLLEASVVQWSWKQDVFPHLDQFNSLHPKLVGKWAELAPLLSPGPVHFAHVADEAGEDTVTVAYWRDVALEAGVEGLPILMDDIGWCSQRQRFVDLDDQPISTMFHLYPWEWLANEAFSEQIVTSLPATTWLEPVWKMIFSNKAILPVLWRLNPGHANLLECSTAPLQGDYVRKPVLAREGANITVHVSGQDVVSTAGDYGTEGYVYQALYNLPNHGADARPVVGSWIVDGEPAGVGIREDGLVTGNTARFIPHVIDAAG